MRRALAAGLVALATTAAVLTSLPAVAASSGLSQTADPRSRARAEQVADRALARAQSALSGATDGRGVTLALRDLRVAYRDLSPTEQQQARALLDRPYVGQSTCGAHVCVHYGTGQGSAAQATATLRTMESVWSYEVTGLGYRAPATDGTAGGDSRFDVYLSNIGPRGIYGYCAPESYVPGQRYRATAYCVLDNDFAEFPLPGDPSRRVTAAHEFFHAIQFNYDFDEDAWILEATAVWMEEQYADDVNDNRQYLGSGQLRRPRTPLDLYDGSTLNYYGNWVFFQRLSQKYGASAILNIWQRLDANTGARDDYSVQGIAGFLRSRHTRLRLFYSDFAGGNVFPAVSYQEGAAYRGASARKSWLIGSGKKVRRASPRLDHLTAISYALRPGARLRGAWKLRVKLDGPKRSSGAGAVVQYVLTNGAVRRRIVHLGKGGNRTLTVPFSRAQVRRVVVTISNAGIRYDCGTGQAYACSGTSKRDGEAWAVQVRALRAGQGS